MNDKNPELTTIMIFEFITQYCVPIIICFCLLGNSLSVYVLFCTKLRYNSSSIYLGAFAMSNIGVLLIVFLDWFKYYEIIKFNEWLNTIWICLEMLFSFLSVWLVVVFTIQRYVTIKWPFYRYSLCTVRLAKIVVMRLTLLAVLYSILFFAFMNKAYLLDWTKHGISIHVIITSVLPATMIVAHNVMIVHNICKQNRIRRNLILNCVASNDNNQSSYNEMSHIEITKMLVTISSIFICLNLPSYICTLYELYVYKKIYKIIYIIVRGINYYLYIISYGINFILYCATGKNFRRELIRLFTKRSDAERNDNIMELNDIRNEIICD